MKLKELFVRHCSPTFAGLKPANLFTLKISDINNQIEELRAIINELNEAGLSCRILCKCKTRVLVFVYNQDFLFESLDQEKIEFLHAMDYPKFSEPKMYLEYLFYKMANKYEFPHEIGIFLGIPLIDIEGYIKNKGQDYKHCGYWKVYGDCDYCKKIFSMYKQSLFNNINKIKKGAELRELISVN